MRFQIYTVDVGGSIPSPPTIFKIKFGLHLSRKDGFISVCAAQRMCRSRIYLSTYGVV